MEIDFSNVHAYPFALQAVAIDDRLELYFVQTVDCCQVVFIDVLT